MVSPIAPHWISINNSSLLQLSRWMLFAMVVLPQPTVPKSRTFSVLSAVYLIAFRIRLASELFPSIFSLSFSSMFLFSFKNKIGLLDENGDYFREKKNVVLADNYHCYLLIIISYALSDTCLRLILRAINDIWTKIKKKRLNIVAPGAEFYRNLRQELIPIIARLKSKNNNRLSQLINEKTKRQIKALPRPLVIDCMLT